MFRDLFSLSGSPVVAAITAMLGATGAALPTPAVAQHAAPLAGFYCTSHEGQQVQHAWAPGLNNVGMARVEGDGTPVIYLNPHALNGWHPVVHQFWYMHECAHHALGHTATWSPLNETEADCWAVRSLRDQGFLNAGNMQFVVMALRSSQASPFGHLPGPMRVSAAIACFMS